jgi:proteasome accessory factor C
VAPERFGVLQSLLAYLLAACGDESEAVIPARDLAERFSIAPEALEEHLSLLNLVNFGGGCYAVYAELRGDEVHVDKELFGDTFRRPPRLTPLEARAIRLALEFVGPMIAAGAHSPLDRVRAKLEETFGAFELSQTPTPQGGAEEDLVATLTRAIGAHRVVELEYLKPESTEVTTRTVEPYTIERRLPHWYVHTWDVDRDAPRSYRLDRTRKVKVLRRGFKPRDGFDPAELQRATRARIWYSPDVARWEIEKGALQLTDGAAVSERAVGSLDWLVGEVLSFRGEAVIIEPAELRVRVAERARKLERELRPARAKTPS